MEQKFKVIYIGQLKDDSNVPLIAQRFADKFKMSQDKATKILLAGKEVTLHSGAEHVKAYKLKAALEGLGLEMRLERVQASTSATVEPEPEEKQNQKQEQETVPEPTSSEPESPVNPLPNDLDKKENNSVSEMSIEPMTDDEETSEDDETDKKESAEKSKEKSNKEEKTNQLAANTVGWELEPMKAESEDAEGDEESEDGEVKTVVHKQEYVDLSKPAVVYEKKSSENDENNESDDSEENKQKNKVNEAPSAALEFIKKFGGFIAAGLIGILFLLKKFGLLSFLKIGGLMTAAAFAGYNPEEACMGNGDCEDAISDQIDACWSYSELEQYDWDNISEEQYFELKPSIEEKFISCFRYEKTGERVLESPIELRFDLIDMCDMLSTPVSDCESIAEKQIKVCYDRSEIIDPIKASGYDYYGSMFTNIEYFQSFYGCFEDNSGNMLFAEYVNEMENEDMTKMLQKLQNQIESE